MPGFPDIANRAFYEKRRGIGALTSGPARGRLRSHGFCRLDAPWPDLSRKSSLKFSRQSVIVRAMQLSHLFRNTEFFVPFKAGETIFKDGDPGDEMYVVLEGEVEVFVHGKSVETVGVDNFLGEMALIDSQPRSATAIAKTDCKLAPINQNRFKFLVQQTPHFALHLMQGMAERLRQRV